MSTAVFHAEQQNAAAEIAVEARSVSMDYGHRRVLRTVSFRIRQGEVVELRGGNGSGKSTLLACLAAGIRPTAGNVSWFGQPAGAQIAQRRWIGVLAHECRLYEHLSLYENLLFVARMYGIDHPRDRVAAMLAETQLADRAGCTPSQVSRGMRQRASIARALIHEPRIVLLDEPSSGLDAGGRAWLANRLARARRQAQTVCLATHDRAERLWECDRVLVLRAGRLSETAVGAPCRQDASSGGANRFAA
jgi:ABC-type multidrug transport system ATPase subunit